MPTITMTDLLDAERVERIDLLTMDIELCGRPKALAGFDIQRFKPQLVCIEAHAEVRQELLDYFARHGYILLGRPLQGGSEQSVFQAAVLTMSDGAVRCAVHGNRKPSRRARPR